MAFSRRSRCSSPDCRTVGSRASVAGPPNARRRSCRAAAGGGESIRCVGSASRSRSARATPGDRPVEWHRAARCSRFVPQSRCRAGAHNPASGERKPGAASERCRWRNQSEPAATSSNSLRSVRRFPSLRGDFLAGATKRMESIRSCSSHQRIHVGRCDRAARNLANRGAGLRESAHRCRRRAARRPAISSRVPRNAPSVSMLIEAAAAANSPQSRRSSEVSRLAM